MVPLCLCPQRRHAQTHNRIWAGQPEGLDIYTEHLATGDRFLSFRRLLARGATRPIMDLDYLLDEVSHLSRDRDSDSVAAAAVVAGWLRRAAARHAQLEPGVRVCTSCAAARWTDSVLCCFLTATADGGHHPPGLGGRHQQPPAAQRGGLVPHQPAVSWREGTRRPWHQQAGVGHAVVGGAC